ncbi:MAG: Fe-S cluster assembly protein HesB [Candidatus Thorarchaeota archaeon]
MTGIDARRIANFQKKIFSWWEKNKRDLPWRRTVNPYYIMVSEIMLQQTQVSRSIEKYLEFIQTFPSAESLANAKTAEVLKVWSGLGYNRRALWLQEAAQQLIEKESFPTTPEELIKLKGIGPYTSRSILIFAFNQDLPTVDTNIRRILIAEGFAQESSTEKELIEIAEKLLPKGQSRDWHNALMDYGALFLTASKTGIKPLSSQSQFKNSSRYHRGKIVKYLTEKQQATIEDIRKICDLSENDLKTVLDSLEKDNLIKRVKETISLP